MGVADAEAIVLGWGITVSAIAHGGDRVLSGTWHAIGPGGAPGVAASVAAGGLAVWIGFHVFGLAMYWKFYGDPRELMRGDVDPEEEL